MAVIRTSSCLFLALFANQLVAQETLFQSNFDSDEGLVVLPGTDDTRFEFGNDYADFDGIPEAPNSGLTAGSGQSGLKLEANIESAEAAAIVVVTDGLELAGMYEVQLDVWLNYNFLAANAVGTTEYGGLGVGHDGEFGGLSGASFIYDTDGDSSRDYILYKDLTQQEIESGQYAVESMNNSTDVFVEAFPTVDIAEKVPLQALVGNTPEGSGGFRWMTVHAMVDTDGIGAGATDDRGTARFTITDADTGNSVEVGTIDNSSGEGVANMSGNVSVLFADLFSSVSNRDDYSFGIFDNLVISSVVDASNPLDCNDDGLVDAGDIGCATGGFDCPDARSCRYCAR